MAKSGAKKLHDANAMRLRALTTTLRASCAFHCVVRFGIRYGATRARHVVAFACTALAMHASLKSLRAYAAPTRNENGEIVDGGGSLKGGMVEYYQDLIYVGAFALATTTYSDWFWVSLLVIPAIGGYLIVTKLLLPYMSMKKAVSARDEREETKEEKRRRERSQRRQAKRRF